MKDIESLRTQQRAIQAKIDLIEADIARSEQAEIVQLVREAYKLIGEAEKIAMENNLEFDFDLTYGMGGTFNGIDWDCRASDGPRPRTGSWVSSSASC